MVTGTKHKRIEVGINGDPAIAGREGVRNKDINGRLVEYQ